MAYTWKGMKKISKAEALKRFNANKEVFLLYKDNTEAVAENKKQLLKHTEGWGYEI